MKQCPVCKTTYTDESLKFCLADGNLLSVSSKVEQPTMVFQDRNPMQINIPPNTVPETFQIPTTQAQTDKKSSLPLILASLFVLTLLAVIGVGAVFLFKPFGGSETAVVSNNSANSNTSNTSANNQNKELEDKLANLERQLQEQKNPKKTTTTQTFPNPQPTANSNNSGSPTAKVKPSSDGFLSLRTEPNVKTGTQLVKIPTGSSVQIENCEKKSLTIDGRNGRWCMVSYNGETGWVFDAWLAY